MLEKLKNIDYSFYIITDEDIPEEKLYFIIEKCVQNYGTIIQYRVKKEKNMEKILNKAKNIKKITDKYNVPLIINDYVKIAKDIDCIGVHIGQDDLNIKKAREIIGDNKIIGLSVSTVEEAKLAEENGADYLGVGAIFPTETKKDAKYVSKKILQNIKKNVKIPVIAIGGITEENMDQLKGLHLNGIAFISEIMKAKNLNEKLKNIKEKIRKIVE